MRKDLKSYPGIERLINKYKTAFRIPENLNYYSKKDYKIAERKYIKMPFKKARLAQA